MNKQRRRPPLNKHGYYLISIDAVACRCCVIMRMINKMTVPKTLRGKYDRLVKLSSEYMEVRREFSSQMGDEFGFDHSETDDTQMIDAVENGSGYLPFSEFIERAEYYKKLHEQTGGFRPIFDCA